MYGFLPWLGKFQVGRNQTATAGTAIVVLIPPMKGAVTHVDELVLTAGTTAHDLYLLRPLNYTTTAGASSSVSSHMHVTLTADPGIFSTNYQYPLLNSPPGTSAPSTLPTFQTADDGIAANDYVVFETPDGAFYFDKVSSVSSLTLTMTADNPTGGIAAGARMWFFGQFGDTDPATALGQFRFTTTVSVANTVQANSGGGTSFLDALHVYDPILFYDANATAADTLNRLEGFYSRF